MKKSIGISMTEGAPWRHTVRFAVPVLLGALLQQFYSTVDMMIVGRFTRNVPKTGGFGANVVTASKRRRTVSPSRRRSPRG